MTNSTLDKIACMMVLCMVFQTLTNPRAVASAAVTCPGVTKSLAPCMTYLKGTGGPTPPPNCCVGVRTLKGMARTTADRRTACNCMKTAAGRMKGLNYGNAARLPNQCGVRMSYTLSPNINCNTYSNFYDVRIVQHSVSLSIFGRVCKHGNDEGFMTN
ncbi:non-specific lipid-transfer protein-like [Silene latifolia]|uniref:non-specific lipid-transfer protein-like n=1 Tax=Silene latifolia TaxID=37657 RepID=UPI003D782D0D